MGPDIRKNLQVRQPVVEGYDSIDKLGWPDPLVDPSNPLTVKVTNGSNGEQSNFDPVSTTNQEQLSLPEGSSSIKTGDMTDQGGNKNKFHTSQQNASDYSTPESERSQ